MQRFSINEFVGGWFLGNFTPVIQHSEDVEIGVKFFKIGDVEPSHMQRKSTEITVLHSGKIRLGKEILMPGDIAVIPPLEYADFEALADGSLTCLKFPSLPNDKELM